MSKPQALSFPFLSYYDNDDHDWYVPYAMMFNLNQVGFGSWLLANKSRSGKKLSRKSLRSMVMISRDVFRRIDTLYQHTQIIGNSSYYNEGPFYVGMVGGARSLITLVKMKRGNVFLGVKGEHISPDEAKHIKERNIEACKVIADLKMAEEAGFSVDMVPMTPEEDFLMSRNPAMYDRAAYMWDHHSTTNGKVDYVVDCYDTKKSGACRYVVINPNERYSNCRVIQVGDNLLLQAIKDIEPYEVLTCLDEQKYMDDIMMWECKVSDPKFYERVEWYKTDKRHKWSTEEESKKMFVDKVFPFFKSVLKDSLLGMIKDS
jgi:hypothetical protein